MKLPQFNNKPTLLRATYHMNTPMFVAGANQNEAELTPTSFKGVMRSWWRALNWSHIRLNSPNKVQALKELHEQEAKLFGVASSDARAKQKLHNGQGACFVNALSLSGSKTWNYTQSQSGVNYLLGQGLYHFRSGLTRQAFAYGQTFTVDLTVGDDVQGVEDVLQLIGLLGSFGSRSRHGFGSVTLIELACKNIGDDEYQPIAFEQDLKTALTELFEKYRCRENEELPPLSAFYQGTRVDIVGNGNKDVLTILKDMGDEEQMYRSFGKDGMVGRQTAEKNFKDDHDFALNLFKPKPNTITHPKRVVFGLPHNYFYSGNSTRGHSANMDADTGRRASPLFRHVHRLTNGNHQVVLCLFKSEFLHEQSRIDIVAKKDGKPQRLSVSASADWQTITNLMNRFNGEIL
ncbi:type III-B CRISPR module RAMP protein Cmr1 [Moraxella bovoculi]|uniref:type III-B CRISPR module RAMP protein Cmr1 n=1 Tax=Moraxella bovoculi TaxID=386891 RepID=UPI003F508487